VIGADAHNQFGQLLKSRLAETGLEAEFCLLVTDDRVGPLYGSHLLESLQKCGFRAAVHRIPEGESSKSWVMADTLYRRLAEERCNRNDVLVALGGGVVSDLTGFVAATWMRGVRFAICPTTLEAAIDAAIGGKTAINLPSGKNLVGAFHLPSLVVIDPTCLRSLPDRDWKAGLAESVKHALIDSEEFLRWHEDNAERILHREEACVAELIRRNVGIKCDFVSSDPFDSGGRRIMLNFGHTIGHAIETACRHELRHGGCVALGIAAELRLSREMGLVDEAVVSRVTSLLNRFGLLTGSIVSEVIDGFRQRKLDWSEALRAALCLDKKTVGGVHRFVLLEGIGRPVVRSDVPDELVRSTCGMIGDRDHAESQNSSP